MTETVTIQRIAQAVGRHDSAVKRRAKRERWPYDEERIRGGRRRLYPAAELPTDVQSALRALAGTEAAQRAVASARDPRQESLQAAGRELGAAEQRAGETEARARQQRKLEGMKRFAALSTDDPKYQRAKARELVLQGLWHLQREQGVGLRQAMELYAAQANAGEIPLPEWVWPWMPKYQGRRAITAGTLRNWHYAYINSGIWALTDGYGSRRGHGKIAENEALKEVVLGAMLQAPHITAKKVKAYVAAKYPELDTASEAAYRRFMNAWKEDNAQLWTYVTNPDRWKNVFMASVGSHFERITRLNQVWELDSTPGDWMLKDGRHTVVGLIDLYSRRIRLYVSKTSTALAVCQVLRRGIQDFGVPEAVRTDNGADYVAEQFETVLRDLEIAHEVCLPFASEQKGTIERHFRTMSHGVLDLLPGFIGHNVGERQIIEARKSFADRVMTRGESVAAELTAEELQAALDRWLEVYHHTPHEGLDGRTPFEVAAGQPVRRISDDRALDMLLAPLADTRTITSKGIRFENHYYDAPELFAHVGREALLKRDEQDIGRLYVYVDGEFVTVAECAELLGISRQERAAAASAAQKRFMREKSRELREHRKTVDQNIAQVVIDHRIEQSRNVEALHRPGEDYTTDGLRAARDAADAREQVGREPEPAPVDEAAVARVTELLREEQTQDETAEDRFRRWIDLHERQLAGEAISEFEAQWKARYEDTSEFRGRHLIYEEFGADAFGGARSG